MRLGTHFMNFTHPGGRAALRAAVGDTAVAADAAGIDWFTAMDHWFQMEHFATAHDPMLEGSRSCGRWSGAARSGVVLVELAPAMPDPAGYVAMVGEKIVRPLAEIG